VGLVVVRTNWPEHPHKLKKERIKLALIKLCKKEGNHGGDIHV